MAAIIRAHSISTAPYPEAAKDNEKRRKLKELSPGFYGERVTEYAAAMKAVDPKIEVGASLTQPAGDTWAPEWNGEVLKAACKAVSTLSPFSWHPAQPCRADWKTLVDASVLHAPQDEFPKIIAEMLYQDKRFCPGARCQRVVLSQMSPIPWATPKTPIVKALFAADAYATLAESGIANASWFQAA